MWNELCQGNIRRPKQDSVEGQVEKKPKLAIHVLEMSKIQIPSIKRFYSMPKPW